MTRKLGKELETRAGLVLLRAALLVRAGEVKRPDTALRRAMKEAGMSRAALVRALGPRARTLTALLAPRPKKKLSHPMR